MTSLTFGGLLSGGVRETVAAFMLVSSLEQTEATCRAAKHALSKDKCWEECICRELAPTLVFPAPASALPRHRVRRIPMSLCAEDVSLPKVPLRFPRFHELEGLADAVNRKRRRAAGMSAPGTTPHLIVNMFKLRPKAGKPGTEAALVSSKVVFEVPRNGRQELWEFKMAFPASGGAHVFARRPPSMEETGPGRGPRAAGATTGALASTELYADVFSVCNGGGVGLRLLDANLRADGSSAETGFCAVSGLWDPEGEAGAATERLMAVICLREVVRPPHVSPMVHALGLEPARRRQ